MTNSQFSLKTLVSTTVSTAVSTVAIASTVLLATVSPSEAFSSGNCIFSKGKETELGSTKDSPNLNDFNLTPDQVKKLQKLGFMGAALGSVLGFGFLLRQTKNHVKASAEENQLTEVEVLEVSSFPIPVPHDAIEPVTETVKEKELTEVG